jgi:hypothetical protein
MAADRAATSPGSTMRPQPSRISGIMDTRVDTTGSAQRHGIEELGRHLAHGVRCIALRHGDHVRRREKGGDVLERHPGQELRPGTERRIR